MSSNAAVNEAAAKIVRDPVSRDETVVVAAAALVDVPLLAGLELLPQAAVANPNATASAASVRTDGFIDPPRIPG
jgi:hypothetical protein